MKCFDTSSIVSKEPRGCSFTAGTNWTVGRDPGRLTAEVTVASPAHLCAGTAAKVARGGRVHVKAAACRKSMRIADETNPFRAYPTSCKYRRISDDKIPAALYTQHEV